MNETKKMFYLMVVATVFVGIVIFLSVFSTMKGNKDVENLNKLFESNKAEIVYLGRPTCGYCTMLEPSLKDLSKTYDFKYMYINTDKVGTSNLSKILKKLDIEEDSFGTPYIAIIKGGKIIAVQNGYVPEDKLFRFFQENGIIGENEKLALNYIDYETYNNILEEGTREIVVITQTGCSHCETAKPVLAEIAKEYDLKINILNMSNFEENDYTSFTKSLKYFEENESWGTPVTFVLDDGKLVDYEEGSVTKEEFIKFFKSQNFIRE